jgi:hypothetical protein
MRKVLLLIAVLTVVLAGCRVETNLILDIEEDGSALVGAEIGYDEEFRQLLEQSGADPDDLFSDLPTVGDDVVTIERTEGDMTYTGVASNVDDLSVIATESTELESFSSFSYEFDDDGATLAAAVSADDSGLGGGDFGELGIDPSQLTDEFFSANVVVTMPGEVTEHNADVVRSDGTLVWQIPLTGSKQINATSSFGSSSTNLLLILLIGLLLVGIIVVIVATVVSRRQSQQAVATAAAAGGSATDDVSAEPGAPGTGDAATVSADTDTGEGSEPTATGDVADSTDETGGEDTGSERPAGSESTDAADDGPDQPETT